MLVSLTNYALVIQGLADINGKASKEEITEALEFTRNAIESKNHEERQPWVEGEKEGGSGEWTDVKENDLRADEAHMLKSAHGTFKDYFSVDEYAGLVARLERGSLGLIKAKPGGPTGYDLPMSGVTALEVNRELPAVDDHKDPVVDHQLREVDIKAAEVDYKLPEAGDYHQNVVDVKAADVDHKLSEVAHNVPEVDEHMLSDADYKLSGVDNNNLSEADYKLHEFNTKAVGESIQV